MDVYFVFGSSALGRKGNVFTYQLCGFLVQFFEWVVKIFGTGPTRALFFSVGKNGRGIFWGNFIVGWVGVLGRRDRFLTIDVGIGLWVYGVLTARGCAT